MVSPHTRHRSVARRRASTRSMAPTVASSAAGVIPDLIAMHRMHVGRSRISALTMAAWSGIDPRVYRRAPSRAIRKNA